MPFRAFVSLPLLATLIVSAAEAGVIRGTLSIRPSTAVTTNKTQDVADAVIYVEKVPEKVEHKLNGRSFWTFWKPPRPRVARVVQMDRRFYPRILVVAAGTPVTFENLDRVYHATFSVSAAKRFDLGRKAPGRCDTLVFARPGVINLHCDIYPDMMGFVVVTPNHAFTRPDSTGSYRLPKLPPGDYTVHFFHPRRGETHRKAEMPARGDVTLDLSF